MFYNETVANTVGGAFLFKNLNKGGVTLIQDCTFFNNFGSSGGAIMADSGGALAAKDNHFSNDERFLRWPEEMALVFESKASVEGPSATENRLPKDQMKTPNAGSNPTESNEVDDSAEISSSEQVLASESDIAAGSGASEDGGRRRLRRFLQNTTDSDESLGEAVSAANNTNTNTSLQS